MNDDGGPGPLRVAYPTCRTVGGGSNNSALLLASDFRDDASHGVTPLLVYPADSGEIVEKAARRRLDFDVVRPPEPFGTLLPRYSRLDARARIRLARSAAGYVRRAVGWLANWQGDLIHTNDLASMLIWGAAGRWVGIPTIWHVRQYRSSDPLDALRLLACDGLIFVAEQNRSRFSRWLAKLRELRDIPETVIYNGVDLEEFSPVRAQEYKVASGDGYRVTFVAQLSERKRPEMFLEVAAEVASRCGRKGRFLVVGGEQDGSRTIAELRRQAAEFGLEGLVEFTGYVEEVAPIMAASDVVVLTSTREGEAFPRVVVEAMASGTPVVATPSAGVPEAIEQGETGFVAHSDTVRELAEYVELIVANPERGDELGRTARAVAEERFNSSRVTARVAEFYGMVTAHDRSR